MSSDHTPCPSLSKRPFRHISSFSIDENYRFCNIIKPLKIMEKHPRHLSSMYIPNRHISIYSFHIFRNNFHRSIIFKWHIFTINVIKQSWRWQSSNKSSIKFCLVLFFCKSYLKPWQLCIPSKLTLISHIVPNHWRHFSLQIQFCILNTHIRNTYKHLEIRRCRLDNSPG